MSRRARWTATLLGAILLAQGVGKLVSPGGYVSAFARFDALPEPALWPVGISWMAAELLCGAGLLYAGLARAPRRRLALASAAGGLAVCLAYGVLNFRAYASGRRVENCTCFGEHLPQRLSLFVLAQDAYMLVFAAWQTWKIHWWRAPLQGEEP